MVLKTEIKDLADIRNICGVENSNIKQIEEIYFCHIEIKGDKIITDVSDELKLNLLDEFFNMLLTISNKYKINLTIRDILYIKNMQDNDQLEKCYHLYENRTAVGYTITNKPIYPKTIKQIEYVKSLTKYDMVFGIGPAGTGKTYLAVVYAVSMLKKGQAKRIILTRPAIEAGESLGFLPGDLKEKVDPYLRPLYDALYDMLGVETVTNYIEKGIIEIAPLAYMRGRTLSDAICILDEAQNTTEMQMKMFLTRLGFNSKMIITGDISQIDLPNGKKSGLITAINILNNIKQIAITKFEKLDVVRHPLVQKILEAYERLEN